MSLKRLSLKKRIILAICITMLFFMFPQKMSAAQNPPIKFDINYDIKSVYYYVFDEYGNAFLTSSEVYFYGSFSNEQKAYILFSLLFDNPKKGKIPFIPDDVYLIGAEIVDDTLILNVSPEILNYGGTANEIMLVSQIINTASGVDGIRYLTLLIGYNRTYLPEGTEILDYELF